MKGAQRICFSRSDDVGAELKKIAVIEHPFEYTLKKKWQLMSVV